MKNRLLKTFTSLVLVALMVISVMPAFAITIGAAEETYTWKRVTNVETLKAGGEFIIGYEATANSGKIIPMANTGSATTSEVGYMYSGAKATSGDKTTLNMNDYNEAGNEFIVTIAESTVNTGKITIKTANGYIGNANTKNNCKLFTEDSTNNGTSFDATFGENDVVTLKNENATYYTFQYNTSSPRFACYGGTQKNLVIYQRTVNSTETETVTETTTETETPTETETTTETETEVEGTSYTEVELKDIKSTDTIIIVSTKGTDSYAMSNDNGSSAAPAAILVTITDGVITTDATNIFWNISNDGGNLTIYPAGKTDIWLYSTNSNNGIRVGDGDAKTFVMDANSGYLKNTSTTSARYLGVYNKADWRTYTTIHDNIAGQTFSFYKLLDANCTHDNTEKIDKVAPTCTTPGKEAGTKCLDCGFTTGCAEIPATGHTWGDIIDGCCECSVCNEKTKTITEVLESPDGTAVVVCGTVKRIDTAWSDTHKNISVTIVDDDGNELYIFRLATKVEVGDIIRVTGTKTTYGTTKEINAGATAEIIGKATVLNSVALSLNKGVTVKVKITIPENWFTEGTKVVFSNGEKDIKTVDVVAGVNVYSVDLTPAQINDALTVKLTDANGTVIFVDEKDVSVSAYKTKAEAAGASSELIDLLNTALVYSDAAEGAIEVALTNDFDGVADHTHSGALFTGFAGQLGTYASIFINVNTANVKEGDTLVLTVGGTEIVNGDIANYITKDGQIVITGLFPANFDDTIYIAATYEGSNATFTFNSYLKAIYNADSSDQSLKNLAVATYKYGLAAEAYLATLPTLQ